MSYKLQVDSESHYQFHKYMSKSRWNSVWHQLDEVMRLNPRSVLEIGPGPGLFKTIGTIFGLNVITLDFDPRLKPDIVASATAIPVIDSSFDVVCAYQMLEHVPYEQSLVIFREMVRVSNDFIVISLPDAARVWKYLIHIPKMGAPAFFVPRPPFTKKEHKFDGEHYWEINKKGYELGKVIKDFSKIATLVKTFRVFENPYHRFFVFSNTSLSS